MTENRTVDTHQKPATLNFWEPLPAAAEQQGKPRIGQPGPNAILVDFQADIAHQHTLARACRNFGIDNRIPRVPDLFATDAKHEGDAWYDALPRITEIAIQWRDNDGHWHNRPCHVQPDTRVKGSRPDRVRIELTVTQQQQRRKQYFIPTDIAIANGDESWPENGILLATDTRLSPEELVDFLSDACHVPAEPSTETDSRRRQHNEFVDRHFAFACRLLLPPDQAAKRTMEHLAQRHLATAAREMVRGKKITITLAPGAPATATVEPMPGSGSRTSAGTANKSGPTS